MADSRPGATGLIRHLKVVTKAADHRAGPGHPGSKVILHDILAQYSSQDRAEPAAGKAMGDGRRRRKGSTSSACHDWQRGHAHVLKYSCKSVRRTVFQ